MDPSTIIRLIENTSKVIIYMKGTVCAEYNKKQQLILLLVQLRGLLTTLEDLTIEVEDWNWATTLRSVLGRNGPLVEYQKTLEEISTTLCGPEDEARASKLRLAAKKLRWPFDEKQSQAFMGTLEHVKTQLLLAINNDHNQLSKVIQADLDFARKQRALVSSDIQRLHIPSLTAEEKALLQSISILDLSSQHYGNREKELKRYAERLLKCEKFISWRERPEPQSLLMFTGGADIGKSVIFQIVYYCFRAWFLLEPRICSIGISFDFNDSNKMDEAAALTHIVEQLLVKHPRFWQYCRDLYLAEGILPMDQSLRIITSVRQDLDCLYLMLDCIDSLSFHVAETLIQQLLKIEPPISIFVTCSGFTPIADIVRMETASRISIYELSGSPTRSSETFEYVRDMILEDVRRGTAIPLSENVVDEIAHRIAADSELLIESKLRWKSISSLSSSEEELRHMLDKPPQLLEEAYQLLLRGIDRSQTQEVVDQVEKLLEAVMDGPMTPKDLREKVKKLPGLPEHSIIDLENADDVYRATSGLLMLDNTQGTIRFAHDSALEHIRNEYLATESETESETFEVVDI